MKTIFTSCFILFVLVSFGQTSFKSGVKGAAALDFNGFDDVVQMTDGSYICIGSSYSDNDNIEGLLIAKFNAKGELLMSKNLVPDSYDEDVEGISIIKTTDGGVAVSGTINDTIALLKFDANLGLTWHHQLVSNVEDYSYGTRLIQTSDGGYLVVGSLEQDSDSDYSDAGTVIKTNSSGNVVWAKQYTDFFGDNSDGFDINDIVATKDGNYLFLAVAYTSGSAGEYDSTYLVKINSTGSVLWSKFISDKFRDQAPISVISTSDGGYLMCGNAGTEDVSNSGTFLSTTQGMLIKLNQNGDIVWSKANPVSTKSSTFIIEVKEDKDGGFIAAGELDSSINVIGEIERPYFLKVNSSGNLLWTKLLPSNTEFEFPFSLVFTSDGGFASAGQAFQFTEDNSATIGAILYKFAPDYTICGNTSPFGSLVDMGLTSVSKSIVAHDIITSAISTTLTVGNIGTGVNLCSIFPLQLLSFNATLQNKSVNIEWKTANEINTDHFTVERSNNGTLFTSLQTLPAKGNSSNVQTYTTSDLQPLFGTSYYRLQQVDKDGKTTYSNTVQITVSANGTVVISPNPVRNDIHVMLQSAASSTAVFTVADMTGKVLLTKTTSMNAGTNTILIPAASLGKGLYVLKIKDGYVSQTVKFLKE